MFDTARKYLWVIKAISKLKLSTQKKVMTSFLTAHRKYVPEKTLADCDSILKCALCPNMCRFDCPVLQAAKSETVSPSGKARIAYLMEMGRFMSDDAVALMYACAGCSACQMWCPFDFSVEDLLIGVRKDLIEKGLVPHSLVQFKENLVKNHTIYENGNTSLGLVPKEAGVLYFAGCTILNRQKEIADATIRILEKAGINFTVLPEEWCCGAPLSILGFDSDFKAIAGHNGRQMNQYKTVVCSCPACAHIFKDVYTKIGSPLKPEILHTSQFLLRLVEEGKITLKECNKEYVYHDPCVLSRKLNICEEPRTLLKYIPGITLKEVQFSREDTRCCGMGGMLGFTNPEIAVTITRKRSGELKEVSNSIVTACPVCKLAFERVNANNVLDISEVVSEFIEE
jgi:fumarate reductase (CoM/CoB) subunit B